MLALTKCNFVHPNVLKHVLYINYNKGSEKVLGQMFKDEEKCYQSIRVHSLRPQQLCSRDNFGQSIFCTLEEEYPILTEHVVVTKF